MRKPPPRVEQLPIDIRFHAGYIIDGFTGCWEWKKGRHKNGYGIIGWKAPTGKKRTYLAHRISGHLLNGWNLFDPLMFCHHCDNKCCVNPDHLYRGTNSDNIRDAFARGLMKPYRHHRKLHTAEIIYMRKLALLGITRQTLAHKFNIRPNSVTRIVNRRQWRDII
jgi:hypothetical protein